MMLNSRVGEVMYVITDPASGQTWEVDPADYLTSGQLNDMDAHPDMILQFSHYLADEWQAKGHDNVEVRANTAISLNGRPAVPLIDPPVDLAAEEHKIGPVAWITSLDEEQQVLAEGEMASGEN